MTTRAQPLVTTAEAARQLGVEPDTLTHWARDGNITPSVVTPDGEPRWDMPKLRRQLAPEPTPDVQGELWTVDQCCRYWGRKRGQPLARSTFFDYVTKGLAPPPEPVILPGTNARVWDSAKVIAAEHARVGRGRSVDRVEWVAHRDTASGRVFWRGPQHQKQPDTSRLDEAQTWPSQQLAIKALTAHFGPGNRWNNTKWGGYTPARRTAALLDTPAAARLTERQLYVLQQAAEGVTHQAIADQLGVTRQRVGQIEHEALATLQEEA